jgi:hypothetical protein
MYINSHLGPCVCTQSPKYLEMAQGHISLSVDFAAMAVRRGILASALPINYSGFSEASGTL